MPREVPLVGSHLLARDRADSGRQLEHLVDQQERFAVRKDLLDLRTAKWQRNGHAVLSLSRRWLRPRRAAFWAFHVWRSHSAANAFASPSCDRFTKSGSLSLA